MKSGVGIGHSRSSRALQITLLVLLDLLAAIVSFMLAFSTREFLGQTTALFDPLRTDLNFYLVYWPIILLWPLVLWREGLYPGLWMTSDQELRRLIEGTTIAGLSVLALTFITQTGPEFSRPILVGWWLVSLFLLPLNHIGGKYLLSLAGVTGPPIVILGANDLTARIIQAIGGQSLPSFVPVAVLTDDMTSDQDSLHGVPIISPTARAGEMARERGVEIAMIALPEASGEELVSIAQDMSQVFRRVLIVPDLYGLSTVQTDVRDLEGLLALEVRTNLLSPGSQLAKRVLELIITALATALFTPLILLIVLALALERQGPILFGHSRVGKGGKRFTAWKFRTMVKDADSILKQALARSPQLKLEWENKQKLKRDPRLTVVGRLLRRFSLDELPQLWNVLRQDMNLVGPRPIVEREVEKYGQAISLYYQVRPGMTGLWQVSGRSDLSYDERIQLDSYYVRNWSVWLDLVILLRTTLAVLGGRGAY